MSRARSLRRGLTLATLLLFALGLGASIALCVKEVREEGRALIEAELRAQARELLAALHASADEPAAIAPLPDREAAYRAAGATLAYALFDAARRPVASSAGLDGPVLPFLEAPGPHAYGPPRALGPDGTVALAAGAPGGHTLVVARGPLDRATINGLFLHELREHLSVLVLFAAVASAVGARIVGRSLRPLERAARDAAAICPATLSRRIPAEGLPLEVRPLVDGVNGALERLDRAYAAQRRLTGDAAHELRTPLAVLRLRLQRASLDGGAVNWPAVERDLAAMERLVGQLLDLAHKEDPSRNGDTAALPATNLARVAREAAAMMLPLAEQKGRPLEVDAPASVPVRGCPDDLRDAVRNLLDNALTHGAGPVRVAVGETEAGPAAGQWAFVEVADEGPGIPEALGEAAFDRFRKADPASPGAGLGLAIVLQVVRAHGGEVKSQPGPGGRIRLSLPLVIPPMPPSAPRKVPESWPAHGVRQERHA